MLTAQSAFARNPAHVALLAAVTVVLIAPIAMAQNPPVRFEDASGRLDFVHRSGEFGGDGLGGAAWFDFDNDGLLDLFLTNGKTQPNALFKNMGNGTFVDVAAAALVANGLGNSGVIAADIDNDGFKDLFLTGDGGVMGTGESPMKLYRNLGNGTFADITDDSGITLPLTNLSAAFGDIDNDGFLDLFIGAIGSLASGRQHRNKLYHNDGDLTFTEIAADAGVNSRIGACANFFPIATTTG